jgi:hypothetical protein
LVKINRGIVVNVDVITGIVIPIEMEIINYIVSWNDSVFLEDIKSTGMRGTIKQSVDKLLQKCPATRAMTRVTGTYPSL